VGLPALGLVCVCECRGAPSEVTHPTVRAIVQHMHPPRGRAGPGSGARLWEYHADALALQAALARMATPH
jgi:hypothetical protein